MRIGYYIAAMGSMQKSKSMDVISSNLANASTPGFKKEAVHFRDFLYQSTYTQTGQGRVRATGNPFDVALSGEGMLRVQSDQGIVYTRAGNLKLNKDRTLVTQEGWPVLGQNGPIALSGTEKEEIRIDLGGQVFDGTNQLDTLYLAKFPPGAKLDRVKNGYFKPEEGIQPTAADQCTVEQGALEDPNFTVVEEMTRMIEDSRSFEAYQKIMSVLDQQYSQLTSKLGGS